MTLNQSKTFSDAIIITVRNSSTRLPNKMILKIVKDLSSIDIVINRAKKTNLPVIIATTLDSVDDIFEKIALKHNVSLFRGSSLNKIKRWYDCFVYYKINNVTIIDGDDLAIDYEICKRGLLKLKSKSVDMIIAPPNIVTGFFTYSINFSGISKLYSVASLNSLDTDVITKFIDLSLINSEQINLKDFEKEKKIRLTLDYEEDLDFFRTLYSKIDVLATGKEIISFLTSNEEITKINFNRQKDFLDNQSKFNESIK
jgi:spore coat polysaccharide biosynthesis protein SpsF